MKKILTLRYDLSSFQWWESKRLYFTSLQIIWLVLVTLVTYALKPQIVNFFHYGLLFFYMIGANVFYFSGFILEILLEYSELSKHKREVSLIYFILLNIISLFVALSLFVIPVI
jgi:hypothetical protein